MYSRRFSLIAILAALMLLLAACGGGGQPAADNGDAGQEAIPTPTAASQVEEEPTEAPDAEPTEASDESAGMGTGLMGLPAVDPSTVEGPIVSAGSSTVFPLAEAIATQFENEGYSGNITIDSIGSGAGFERFCVAGETDVSNASRPIRDEEVASCQDIGREPIEFRVGTDALAVVVNPENDWIESATFEELALLFSNEATTWSDVNSDWPDEPIQRFIPGTDSGTFDYFVEEVYDENEEPILSAENTQLSEDDNVLVQGVEGSPYAIGFFGFAYYAENQGALRALSIEGVEPSAESVDAGEYPLARPLFIYSTAEIMQEKPQVAAYVNYFLQNANDLVREVGYFPVAEEAMNATATKWLMAMGEMEGDPTVAAERAQ